MNVSTSTSTKTSCSNPSTSNNLFARLGTPSILRWFFILMMFVSAGVNVNGQTLANYTFSSSSTASLTDMTSGTTVLSGLETGTYRDSYASAVTAMPFPFLFMGAWQTQFSCNSNGQMRFGSTVISTGAITAPVASTPYLAPMAGDNAISITGVVHYKVTGSYPSRVMTIAWDSILVPFNSTANTLAGTVQARLYEGTGAVEFVYGRVYNNGASSLRSIFLGSSNTATTNGYVTVGATPTFTLAATNVTNTFTAVGYVPNLSNNTDGSRWMYSFIPTNTHNGPSSLNFTNVGTTSMTLNWTVPGNTTGILGYAVYASTDGGNTYNYVNSVAGAATATIGLTGLTPNTSYLWSVYSYNEGALSSTSANGNQGTNACSISGTKSVGPSGNYATLTAAIADLKLNGAAGPVILELNSTYVSTSETFPIALNAIPCASAVNTITIRPAAGATGRVITSANTTATISFDGGSYYIIDGRLGGTGSTKSLNIINTSAATGGAAIQFINESNTNTVKYNVLKAAFGSTTSGIMNFLGSTVPVNGNDNNTIDNNDFDGQAGAAASPTTGVQNGIYSAGPTTTSTANNSGNIISNNNFFDIFRTGATITLNAINITTGSAAFSITGNSIYQTATRTSTVGAATVNGIVIATPGGPGGYAITNNFIGGTAASAGGTAWTMTGAFANRFQGLNLIVSTTVGAAVSNVSGNIIQNMNWSSTSGATTLPGVWAGINMNSTCGAINITGNTIGATTGTGSVVCTISTTGGISVGIGTASTGAGNISISNNNVGSITVAGNAVGISHSFIGVFNSAALTGSLTINGNTVGSTSTASSVQYSTAGTGTTGAVVSGIINSGAPTLGTFIYGNTVANFNNAYVPAAAYSSSTIMRGIWVSSGIDSIAGNTVRNFTTAANATGTGSSASIIGIGNFSSTAGANYIRANTVHSLTNSNTTAICYVTGIYYFGPTTGGIIDRNLVYSLTSPSTIALVSGINAGGATATYQNNMIRLGIDAAGASITTATNYNGFLETGGNNTIVHNTIYIGGTGVNTSPATNSYAFYNNALLTGTRVIRDNIFMNVRSSASAAGKHYAIRIGGTTTNPTGLTINNNIYRAIGSFQGVLGFYNSLDVSTLGSWQTAVGQDAASLTSDPCLNNPTAGTPNLHLTDCSGAGSPADGGGSDVGVTNDYDNDVRANLTPTDIGADAGNYGVIGVDVGITTLVTPSGSTACYTATETVTVTLRNFGVNTIDFSVNPVTITVTSTGYSDTKLINTGTLASNATQNEVMPLTINMTANGTYTFVSTATVSGDVQNANNSNTTVRTVNTMGGTYSVGAGQAPTGFNTLTAAIAAYNSANCITAPIVFNLVDATYSGSETFPITINANSQAGPTKTLTIKPNTTATISGAASAGGLIVLSGADYVTIDGSNSGGTDQSLTITNTGTTTSTTAVSMASLGTALGATNNTIKNCIITTGSSAVATYGISVGGTTAGTAGSDNDNNTLQNNNISAVANGIYAVGNASVSALGMDNISITKNTITTNTTIASIGIRVGNGLNGSISQNTFSIEQTVSGAPVAISLETGFVSSSITRNNITKSYTSAAGGYGGRGITVGTATATSNLTIANNFISGVNGNTNYTSFGISSSMGIAIGIIGNSSTLTTVAGGVNIYHNTINMYGNHSYTSATLTAALYVGSGATALDVRNNIFVNALNNTTTANSKNYCIYSVAANTAYTNINYNNYAPVSSTNSIGIVGFLGSDQSTLALWKLATAQDVNSSNIAPAFTSNSDLHMNVNNNPTLENTGQFIATVTNDYDNDPRTGTPAPDMGADEWASPAGINVGATVLVAPPTSGCYTNLETITIRVKNHSNNTAINFTTDPVNLTVQETTGGTSYNQTIVINGSTYGPVSLAPQATTDITFPGTIDMSATGTYTFKAYTSIPVAGPGGLDINIPNDTILPYPTRSNVALAVGTVSANPAGGYCVTGGTPTLTLTSSAGGTIQWQESTVSSSGPWTNVGTTGLTYTPSSAITVTTYYQVVVSCGASNVTSSVATVTLSNPQILTVIPGSRCGTGTVQLCATGSAGVSFNWYTASSGGVALTNAYSNIPITAGSFNNDIVANGVGTSSIVGTTYPTIGVDGQLYTLIDNTFKYVSTNALPTCYMPTNNQMTSLLTPSLTYQLQSYSAPNAVSISNSSTTYTNPLPASRVVTLATAASYGTLKVLYESIVTVGSLTVDATVTFTDASTQTFTGNSCVNWFIAGSTAFRGVGRTSPTGNIECGTTPNFFPNLFELSLAISPANYAKQVASITFSIPTVITTGTTPASVNYFHVMALGGNAPSTGCFTTPSISANTTYYVSAASGNGTSQVSNHGVPNVNTSTQNSGVLFTLNQGVTLNSIDVYSTAAGTATVTLLNSALATIYTSSPMPIVASTNAVPQTLSLGWSIPAGADYRILVSNTGNALGYHTGVFPIALGNGVGSVTTGATASGTTTLNYFVYNMNTSVGCESARTPVLATVTAPPPLSSATASPSTICLGQSSTLNATSTNANYSYVWTPGNLANGATVTPTTTTTYTVTATDNITNPGSPCVITDVATVTVNPVPSNVTMSPTAATVCAGGNVSLTATSGQNVSGVVGAGGTTTLGGTNGNPYRSGYGSTSFSKNQMLILATELSGLGFQAGSITSLGFTVTAITAGTEIYNLKISMAHTALAVLTTTGETAIGTLVYTHPGSFFTPVVGVNQHDFQTPFVWDGTSNVLVTVCQNLGTPSTTTTVGTFTTTGIMNTQAVGTTVDCATTTAMITATSRPIMTIAATSAAPITWSPSTYLNTTSGNTVISTPLSSPITYTATATLGSCTKTNTVTVTLSSLAVSAVSTNVLCNGGSTGTITATATGGTAPYTYSINGTTFQASNVFNVGPGTYTIYVKDASTPANCTVLGNTMVVTQPAVLTSAITATTDPTCNSGSLNNNSNGSLTAVGGGGTAPYTYVINGPTVNNSGASSGIFTGLTAGSYTVTITDFNGCIATSTASVLNNPAAPAVSASNSGPICAGSNATLTATPGTYVSYAWTGPGTINNANTDVATAVTPANANVFTVLITDNLGCTNTATTTVSVVANAAVSVSLAVSPSNEVCAGSSVTFTATPTNGGATPNYQFFVNAVSVQNGSSNTYVTTTLGDQDVVTVVLTSSVTCTTGNPATSNAIIMTISSNVFVDVTVAASPSATVCSGTSVTYTATPTAGGPLPMYEFFVNNISVQNSALATYSYVPANGDQIYVILTSSFDCAVGNPATSATTTMTVNPTPAVPIITPSGTTTFCNGGSVTLSSSYATGNQWYKNTVLQIGETNQTLLVTTSGSYTVIHTSAFNCPSPVSAATVVTVNANPTATITGTTTFCVGSSTTLSAATSTAGSGTITGYQWVLDGVTNLGTSVTQVVNVAGSYTVIVTNSNGCSTTSAATVVTTNPSPTASISPSCTLLGPGQSATLTASPASGVTYSWTLNGGSVLSTSNPYTTGANTPGSYLNIPVTGFTNDIVANGVGDGITMPGVTYPLIGADGQKYCLIDNTYKFAAANALPTCFMPTTNQVASLLTSGLTYQLQSYSANNAMTVSNSSTTYSNPLPASGALTLSTPAKYATLKVLYESVVTVGSLSVDAVVTFTDATTQTFSGNSMVNWFTAGSTAFRGMGRTTPTGTIECGTTPNFYPNLFELNLTINPANYSKLVQSITFSIPLVITTGTTAATVNYFHAMAVGGSTPPQNAGTYQVVVTNGNGCTASATQVITNLSGPLVGGTTYSIPTTCGGFASIAAAVSYLNTFGITGTGDVTISVTAPYSETAPPAGFALTATGTATNQIKFVKSGAGAVTINAGIGTATPASGVPDGMFQIAGGDYITIDGYTFTDGNTTNPASMEFGVGLFKASLSDGAQNNTVQNCTFNMQRVNNASSTAPMVEGSVAILAINATNTSATTALTPTTAAGANSNNRFYSNSINGGNYGIVLSGFAATTPFTAGDAGNDIGGTALATGNTILNYGGGAAAANPAAGIRANNQWGVNMSYNTINNNNGSGVNHVTTLRGIYGQAGTSASATINNNTVTIKGGGTTSSIYAIDNAIGATAASNTVSMNNNSVTNCTYTTATSGAFYGIENTASANNVNINGNTISGLTLNSTVGTGGLNLIYNSGIVPGLLSMSNNTVQNLTGLNTTGTIYVTYNSTSSPNANIQNNTFSNIGRAATATSGTIYVHYNASSPTGIQNYTGNTVTNITSTATTGTGSLYGLYNLTNSASTWNVNNNNYSGLTSGSGITYCMYLGYGNLTANNNTISNVSTSGTTYGMYIGSSVTTGGAIYSNTINGISCSGASAAVYGIYTLAITPTIYRNKIYDIQSSGATGTVYGIYTAGGTTLTIRNNIVGDLRATTSTLTAPAPSVSGLYINSGTTVNAYYNTFNLNATSTGTNFGTSAVYVTATPTTVNLRNNIFVNNSTANGTGKTIAHQRTAVALTNYGATSNNNLFYAGTPSATKLIFFDGTNSDQTLAAYKTRVSTRDAASIAENPTYVSTTGSNAGFLHINPTVPTGIESGAINISGITDDFDGDIRQGNAGYLGTSLVGPDMGADEFEGTPLPCTGAVGGTASAVAFTCTSNTATAITASGASTGGGISYQWEVSATGGGVGFANVSGGTGANTITYTTPAGLAAGTYYYRLNVTCSAGPVTGYSSEVTIQVRPTPTASASNNGPLCSGASMTLTGVTNIGTTFAWSGPNGFTSTLLVTTVPAPLNGSGNYIFTATLNGCSASATTPVTISNTPPSFIITPSAAVVCAGNSATFTAGGVSGSSVVGTPWDNTTTLSTTGSPYRSGAGANYIIKTQMIIRASEMTAAGFTGGNVTALGFQITTSSATTNLLNFAIRMGNTASTVSTSTFEATGGLSLVYSRATETPNANGLFTHPFDVPFYWDGSSNIVIQVCQGNGSPLTTTAVAAINPGFVGCSYAGATTVDCLTTTAATTTTTRPVMTITMDGTPSNVTWSPGTGLNTTTGPVVIATPSATTTYTATSTSGSCSSSATATVTVNPLPLGTVSGTTAVCLNSTAPLITFTGTTGTAPYTFTYNINGGSNLTATTGSGANPQSVTVSVPTTTAGTFTYNLVNLVDQYCAQLQSSSATVTVNTLPAAATGTDVTVCYDGSAHTGSATAPSGSSVVWYTASTGGTLTTAPSGTNAGTYTAYAASKHDITGCESATRVLVTVTINALPTVSFTGLTGPYCTTDAAVTLTGNHAPNGTFSGPGITDNANGTASFNPATAGAGTHSITYTYSNGTCSNTSTQQVIVNVCATAITVNLKVWLQGYYQPGGSMASVMDNQTGTSTPLDVDSIAVELHDPVTYALVEAKNAMLHTNGLVSATFTTTAGTYYIAIKHRNSVQTWTTDPVACTSSTPLYNFATAANKAFADNQVLVETGVWAVFTGDINQDDFIDSNDFPDLDTDIFNGVALVYSTTDLNGDGFVDSNDFPVLDNNIFNGVAAVYPQ